MEISQIYDLVRLACRLVSSLIVQPALNFIQPNLMRDNATQSSCFERSPFIPGPSHLQRERGVRLYGTLLQLLSLIFLLGSSLINTDDVAAQIVTVGKATYRTDLPPNSDGKPRRLMDAKPLVSDRFVGPTPTNDWCSSLVWPSGSEHSLAMFPHPLALKANESGLGMGYNPVASVTDSLKDGKVFQKGSNYKFPYRQSMSVGLKDVTSSNCVLDQQSDWTVTALWQSESDQLRATFGHGLPMVYFERQGKQPVHIQFSKSNLDRRNNPVDPIVFEQGGFNGKHNQADGKFLLSVNAGKNVGVGSKVRIRYDFDGDGKTDRVEVFSMMPTDPVDSSWEAYSNESHPLDEKHSNGEKQDFKNGIVTVEFWKVFGEGQVELLSLIHI